MLFCVCAHTQQPQRRKRERETVMLCAQSATSISLLNLHFTNTKHMPEKFQCARGQAERFTAHKTHKLKGRISMFSERAPYGFREFEILLLS